MHTGERLLRGAWLLWCGLMLALCIEDAWTVWHDPSGYNFGGEGPTAALWYYASPRTYGTMLALATVWYGAGALLCVRKGEVARVFLFLHAGISVLQLLAVQP